jgi:hypothetical protein
MIIGKLIGTLTLLVIYPHNHPHITSNECLAQNYIGPYAYTVLRTCLPPPDHVLTRLLQPPTSPQYIFTPIPLLGSGWLSCARVSLAVLP